MIADDSKCLVINNQITIIAIPNSPTIYAKKWIAKCKTKKNNIYLWFWIPRNKRTSSWYKKKRKKNETFIRQSPFFFIFFDNALNMRKTSFFDINEINWKKKLWGLLGTNKNNSFKIFTNFEIEKSHPPQ